MKLKSCAVKELESLRSSEIMRVYEMIISLKAASQQCVTKKINPASYMRVRDMLKQCKGSMSEDIAALRGDRI